MVKRGVSSKADRLENETFVKKGSAAQNWPIPNSGLDVLNALDAWSLPLTPHGPGGVPSQEQEQNEGTEPLLSVGLKALPVLP